MQRKSRFALLSVVLLVLGLLIGPAAAQEAPEGPEVAACLPGAGYASGCDVDQDNDIDIFDIQLTAGRWNTSGAYTSSHTHWGETWTGTGLNGLRLENTFASGFAYALYGQSDSTAGRAIYCEATAAGGTTYGVYGKSNSTSGRGVYGVAAAASGATQGVYGAVASTAGSGVYGLASASSGATYGVYGLSYSSEGHGVYGLASANSGTTYGVYGQSNSSEGRGVYGNGVYGVYGDSPYIWGAAVYGHASLADGSAYGVYGLSDGAGTGVYGATSAASGQTTGVQGFSNSSSGYGVYGSIAGAGYGLYTPDNLYVGGSCTGCLMTFIARNSGPETLQVGEVTAIGGVGPMLKGHTRPALQVRQAAAGDAVVLGVVYSRGAFHAASNEQPAAGDDPSALMGEGPAASDSVHPTAGEVAPGDYLLVAVSGMAQVRVAPGAASLAPGVRLVMGDVPGRAQAAGQGANPGTAFARALEDQPDENGLVWALITPQ